MAARCPTNIQTESAPQLVLRLRGSMQIFVKTKPRVVLSNYGLGGICSSSLHAVHPYEP
jgi:hypothetical protein